MLNQECPRQEAMRVSFQVNVLAISAGIKTETGNGFTSGRKGMNQVTLIGIRVKAVSLKKNLRKLIPRLKKQLFNFEANLHRKNMPGLVIDD